MDTSESVTLLVFVAGAMAIVIGLFVLGSKEIRLRRKQRELTNKRNGWKIFGITLLIILLLIGAVAILAVLASNNNKNAEEAVVHLNKAVNHFSGAGGPQGLASVQNIDGARAELAVARDRLDTYQNGTFVTEEDREIADAVKQEMNTFENLMNISRNIITDGVAYDNEITQYQQAYSQYNAASANRIKLIR